MNNYCLRNLKCIMILMVLTVTSLSSYSQCNAAFTSTPDTSSVNTFNFSPNEDFGLSHEWDFGDGNYSTEEDPSHTYTEAGTYTVCLTITHCIPGGTCVTCTECEDIVIDNINHENYTAISTNEVHRNIVLYPNPFRETLTISPGDDYDNSTVSLINTAGEILLQKTVNPASAGTLENIDVSHLESGIYFVQIITNSEHISTVKIIKE